MGSCEIPGMRAVRPCCELVADNTHRVAYLHDRAPFDAPIIMPETKPNLNRESAARIFGPTRRQSVKKKAVPRGAYVGAVRHYFSANSARALPWAICFAIVGGN